MRVSPVYLSLLAFVFSYTLWRVLREIVFVFQSAVHDTHSRASTGNREVNERPHTFRECWKSSKEILSCNKKSRNTLGGISQPKVLAHCSFRERLERSSPALNNETIRTGMFDSTLPWFRPVHSPAVFLLPCGLEWAILVICMYFPERWVNRLRSTVPGEIQRTYYLKKMKSLIMGKMNSPKPDGFVHRCLLSSAQEYEEQNSAIFSFSTPRLRMCVLTSSFF